MATVKVTASVMQLHLGEADSTAHKRRSSKRLPSDGCQSCKATVFEVVCW